MQNTYRGGSRIWCWGRRNLARWSESTTIIVSDVYVNLWCRKIKKRLAGCFDNLRQRNWISVLSLFSFFLSLFLFVFLVFFVVCGGGGWSNVPSAPPPLNLPVLMNYLWEQKLSFINLISLFGFLWVNKYKLRTLQTLYIREIRYGIEMYLIPGLICVVDRYSYDGLRLGVH